MKDTLSSFRVEYEILLGATTSRQQARLTLLYVNYVPSGRGECLMHMALGMESTP